MQIKLMNLLQNKEIIISLDFLKLDLTQINLISCQHIIIFQSFISVILFSQAVCYLLTHLNLKDQTKLRFCWITTLIMHLF